jgi:hypothetical protein
MRRIGVKMDCLVGWLELEVDFSNKLQEDVESCT